MTYDEWLKEVDSFVADWTGISLEEMPDWLSRDAFNDGLSPDEAAEEALTQIGYYTWVDDLQECDAD
jgi:hypothetical protein